MLITNVDGVDHLVVDDIPNDSDVASIDQRGDEQHNFNSQLAAAMNHSHRVDECVLESEMDLVV